MYDLIIVGGGIVGLTILKEAIQHQLNTLLIDAQAVGKNTSYAAAGMLAPINELEHGEETLLTAGLKSVPLYLEYQTLLGNIGLNQKGTLEIALTDHDKQYLHREFLYRKKLGLNVEWLSQQETLQKEPALTPHLRAAIFSPSEWQLDNRLLLQKIPSWAIQQGATILENQKIIQWENHQTHLSVSSPNQTWYAKHVAFCLGYTPQEPFPLPYKVYPVKGQMMSLKHNPQIADIQHVIRFKTRTLGNGYIVPKNDRILIGATNEEMGNHTTLTAGGILDILRKAYAALPAIYDLEILETWAALRPSTHDRHPFILKKASLNLFFLNGFYRNGFCLAPLFAKNLIQLLLHSTLDPEIQPFFKTF